MKKVSLFKLIFASGFFLPMICSQPSAMADPGEGNQTGNGGNAVVCYAPDRPEQVTSIEMFDYWEMSRVQPIQGGVDLGAPNLGVKEKIKIFSDRIALFDLHRSEAYRDGANEILDHLNEYLADGIDKTPIYDGTDLATPTFPCKKVQFAIQLSEPLPGRRRFQINRELYLSPFATNDARAGLILHELIYREAIALGQSTSDRVRPFNYTAATRFIEGVDAEGYDRLLKSIGFTQSDGCLLQPIAHLPGHYFSTKSEASGTYTLWRFCGRNRIQGPGYSLGDATYAEKYHGQNLTVSAKQISIQGKDGDYLDPANASNGYTASFSDDGTFLEGRIQSRAGKSVGKILIEGQPVSCVGMTVNANGRVVQCFSFPTAITFHHQNNLVQREVDLYPSGQVKYLENLSRPVPLKVAGSSLIWKLSGELRFNEAGEVIAADFPKGTTVKVGGYVVSVDGWRFEMNDHGNAEIVARTEVTPGGRKLTFTIGVTVEGKKVLGAKPLTPALKDFLDGVCRQSGFFAMKFIDTTALNVGDYTEFYDPLLKKVVAKFDEKVTVFDNLACELDEVSLN